MTLRLPVLLGALLTTGRLFAVEPIVDEARMPEQADPAPAAATWRSDRPASPADVAAIGFQPLPSGRIDALKRHNAQPGIKAMQVGIGRQVASEADAWSTAEPVLAWQAAPGGLVTRIEVTSPAAAGLRVGLRVNPVGGGAELRVAGSDRPDRVHVTDAADLRDLVDADGLYWTDVTEGERQSLELFVPAAGHDDGLPVIRIDASSHLLVA